MSIIYLIPGNLSSSNYGIKEIKRRENLLKKWAFPNSKIKVFDVPNGGSSIESSYEEIASIIPAVDRLLELNKFENIEYLIDHTQDVAKKYGAVCTPDFFGYNRNLELQYRGRIRELKDLKPIRDSKSDLRIAMKMIAQLQKGPEEQIPSMGCNIKWFR